MKTMHTYIQATAIAAALLAASLLLASCTSPDSAGTISETSSPDAAGSSQAAEDATEAEKAQEASVQEGQAQQEAASGTSAASYGATASTAGTSQGSSGYAQSASAVEASSAKASSGHWETIVTPVQLPGHYDHVYHDAVVEEVFTSYLVCADCGAIITDDPDGHCFEYGHRGYYTEAYKTLVTVQEGYWEDVWVEGRWVNKEEQVWVAD